MSTPNKAEEFKGSFDISNNL